MLFRKKIAMYERRLPALKRPYIPDSVPRVRILQRGSVCSVLHGAFRFPGAVAVFQHATALAKVNASGKTNSVPHDRISFSNL